MSPLLTAFITRKAFLCTLLTLVFFLFMTNQSLAMNFVLPIESDTNINDGDEVFYITYDTFGDLLANNQTSAQFGAIDVNPSFTTTGLAFDGSQYVLQIESDTNINDGDEVFYITYDTFGDLLANNQTSAQFGAIDVNPSFTTTGLAFDGNGGAGEPIPEPSTMLLFGTGIGGLAALRWKR